MGDGGCKSLIDDFTEFKNSMIHKYDLRPSEYNKLDDTDVGEPLQFSAAIDKYKQKLMSEMKL